MAMNPDQWAELVSLVDACGIPDVLRLLGKLTAGRVKGPGLAGDLKEEILWIAVKVERALAEQGS
jgi:hypothetical protein